MTGTDDQREVIDFLSSGAAFDDRAPVTRIETHGAIVFLCGGTALKLKRSVTYDYMDLSTPQLRHRMLLRELELNRRAAPTIYRDVVAVTRGPGGMQLGGDGEAAVDWVLRMNRFPAEDDLDRIAERGDLDGALADEIGGTLRAYHRACPVRAVDGATLIDDILAELDRVLAGFASRAGTDRWGGLRRAMRAALRTQSALLRQRGREGHVRRGHGDLHLRNLVLIDGRPVPFDALEFDETLGTCDVLYDLAFLLMDLCHRDLPEAATRVLSAYLTAARGSEDRGLAALPLFIAIRAAIRAMVLLQTDQARDDVGASEIEIAAYLAVAETALAPHPVWLVAIGGLSGSGKTAVARALAPRLGAPPGAVHLSTDAVRKAGWRHAPSERLGQAAYTDAARGLVYETLLRRAREILRGGHSVVLDGTYQDEAQRKAVRRLGAASGAFTACLWLAADPATLEARVAARRGDASDADVAVLRNQIARDTGAIDWDIVPASAPLPEVVAAARQRIAASGTETGAPADAVTESPA